VNFLLLKTHELHIDRNVEDTIVRADGGIKIILIIKGRAGTLKQVSYRTSELDTVMIIRVDGEYNVEFPTAAQIVTNHTLTSSYSPESYFAHKSGASPYALTSTYKIDFEDSLEVVIKNSSSSDATVTDGFLVANLCTKEYLKDKDW